MLKPIEIEVARLHSQAVGAVTLWPLILYRRGYRSDQALRAHEYYHWRQALHWGVAPWYVCYVILFCFYFRRPSREHPFERPAYRLQEEVMGLLAAGEDIKRFLPS